MSNQMSDQEKDKELPKDPEPMYLHESFSVNVKQPKPDDSGSKSNS